MGEERPEEEGEAAPLSALAPYLLLLALCLLVVFRVVGFVPVLLCVAAVVLAVNRRLFRSVDYFLLLTFLCFFIFIGNLKRIPALNDLLLSLVGGARTAGRRPGQPGDQQRAGRPFCSPALRRISPPCSPPSTWAGWAPWWPPWPA